MTKTVTVQSQQKWEYCYLTRKTEGPLVAELNHLGQEGWELLDVLYYKDLKGVMNWTGFLKRPSDGSAPAAKAQAAAAATVPAAAETPLQHEGFDLGDEDFKLQPD